MLTALPTTKPQQLDPNLAFPLPLRLFGFTCQQRVLTQPKVS